MSLLRNIVRLVFPVVAVLLAVTIFIGMKQYGESARYSSLIAENEKMLFRFATLRESITEALITGDSDMLKATLPELESLHLSFLQMQESGYVPLPFKLDMAEKIDVAGVVILLRQIDSASQGRSAIQQELRRISDYLLKYDRILVSQARSSMLDLQKGIIGFMGLVIAITSFSLILLYAKGISPLLVTVSQLENVKAEGVHGGSEGYREVTETVNETVNRLNGMINYAQLLADSGKIEPGGREAELLQKIIDTGTDIAGSWKRYSTRREE